MMSHQIRKRMAGRVAALFDAAKSKGIIAIFNSNIISKACLLLSNIVVVVVLTQDEYGILSSVNTTYSMFMLCNGMGTLGGVLQYGSERGDSQKKKQYYKFALKAALLFNIFLGIIMFLYATMRSHGITSASVYIKALCFLPILDYLTQYCETFLRCHKDNVRYARILNIVSFSYAIFTLSGAYVAGVKGVIFGRYMSAGLSGFIGITMCRQYGIKNVVSKSTGKLSLNERRSFVAFSIGMGFSAAASTALYLIDVWMIDSLIEDAATLAIYKVATLIPDNLIFISMSVTAAVLPYFAEHNQDSKWFITNIKKVFAVNLILCGGISLLLIMLAPTIVPLLWGKEYSASILPLQILCGSFFLIGSFRSLGTNLLSACRKVKGNLFIGVMSCFLDVVLNLLFIRNMGYIGAAWATLSVSAIASIISMCLLWKTVWMFIKENRGK